MGERAGAASGRPSWITSPAVATLALAIPLLIGFGLLQLGRSGDPGFLQQPEFLVWSAMAGVSVAVWTGVAVGMLGTLRQVRRLYRDGRPAIDVPGLFGMYTGFALLIFAVLVLANPPGRSPLAQVPLDHVLLRTRALVALGLIAAAPIVVTLWLITERVRWWRTVLESVPEHPGACVEELRGLWRYLLRALVAASVVVSAGVVTAGAQRNALIAYDPGRWEAVFPASALALYGGVFTAAFAGVYLPALVSWRSRGQQLVRVLHPVPEDGRPSTEWLATQAALERVIGLQGAVQQRLSGVLVVLGPLLTSLLAGFVPQVVK
jgi:hypothetical protein